MHNSMKASARNPEDIDTQKCEHCKLSVSEFFHNESWLGKIFEHTPTGIAVTEVPSQRSLLANKRFLEIVGYSEEKILNKNLTDITHPEDWAREKEYLL